MKPYQSDFIDFIISQEALLFGDFTLKSGKQSPYFFNAGKFQTGAALSKLGQYYADCIVDSGIEFDMLFGPAYKGIPLVSTVAIALAEKHGIDTPYCFNRKEAKAHGEGGVMVGAPLKGRVLIVDDVVTRGTAFGESLELIGPTGAEVAGLIVSLDRQEKEANGQTAIQRLSAEHGCRIDSIVSIVDVVERLKASGESEMAEVISAYLA